MTRSELLAARGYSSDVIAGHRRELEPVSVSGDDGVIADPAEPVTSPANGTTDARPCVVCGDALAPNRQKTCGPVCAAEHKRRVKAAGRHSNGNGQHAPLSDAKTPFASHTAEPFAWEPLHALVGAGAQVEEVRLTMNGASWSLVRSRD